MRLFRVVIMVKQLTPIFLPGKSHGQRSLVAYSPCSHRVGYDRATNATVLRLYRGSVSDSATPQTVAPRLRCPWVAMSFSRESTQPRDQSQVSHIAGGFFTV